MGSQISTRREDFACGSAVIPMLSEGSEIELSDFEAEDVTLKGYYLSQVHRQKCKSSIDSATRTRAHAQLMASFPWTPARRAPYSRL